MTYKKDIALIRDRKFISKEPHEIAYQKGLKKEGKKPTGKKYKKGKKPLFEMKKNHTERFY